VWSDQRYDDETTHPFGRSTRRDEVAPDTALFRVYRELIALRRQHLRLFVDGSLNWLHTDDARGLLAYERVHGDQRAIVAFNVSDAPLEFSVAADGRYRVAFPARAAATFTDRMLRAQLPPRGARIWIRE
jgi:glycosidase